MVVQAATTAATANREAVEVWDTLATPATRQADQSSQSPGAGALCRR